MRPRNILIAVAVALIVAMLALSLVDQLLVDYLWYGRLGFGGVFNTTVGAEIAIFLIVWLGSVVGVFASGLIAAAGAALLALFAAQGEAASWDTYLKGLYGVPFGIVEQAFGNDIGFYVFTMPLLEEIRDLFLMLIVLAAGMAIAVYWARGALDFKESPPRVSPGAAAHLSVLLGLFFVPRAVSYWIGRFDLLFHSDGVVFG